LRDIGIDTVLDQDFSWPGERVAQAIESLAHTSTVLDMTGPRPERLTSSVPTGVPIIRDPFYADSQARVAITSVSTPVCKVGWMTGANFGL
jgi:hypothetical protein